MTHRSWPVRWAARLLVVAMLMPSVQWCGVSWADFGPECYVPCAIACAVVDVASDASCAAGSGTCGASDSACPSGRDDRATTDTESGDDAGADRAWCPSGPLNGHAVSKVVLDDASHAVCAELDHVPPATGVPSPLARLVTVSPPAERASAPPPIRGPPVR